MRENKTLLFIIATILLISILGIFFSTSKSKEVNQETQMETNTQNSNTTPETANDTTQPPADLQATIIQAIQNQFKPNVVILDVRTKQEWDQEHVLGAEHWSLEENLIQGRLPEIDTDTQIYIYCRSGRRAGEAIQIMQQAGYKNLTNIRGLEDWKAAGGQTI